MGLTAEQRSLRARIGAYSLHAQRDPHETTAAARKSFLARFELEVDPEGTLPEAELNARGSEGWELVGVVPLRASVQFFFKCVKL